MSTVAYETARRDFEIKFGNDIRTVPWTIDDSAGVDWVFNIASTSMSIKIYEYKGSSTALVTRNQSATVGLSVAGNVITWNDIWSNVNLALGAYYYQITYNDSVTTSQPIVKIADGYITIT